MSDGQDLLSWFIPLIQILEKARKELCVAGGLPTVGAAIRIRGKRAARGSYIMFLSP